MSKFTKEDYSLISDGLDIALYVMEEATVSRENDLSEEDRTMAFSKLEAIQKVNERIKLLA